MELDLLRDEIDQIDDRISALFEQRMALVEKIANQKKATGTAVSDPAREQSVLNRICCGRRFAPQLRCLYDAIFKISRAYQENRR